MVRVRSEIRAAEEKLSAEGQGYPADPRRARSRRHGTRRARSSASLETTKKETIESNVAAVEYAVLKREVDSNRQMLQSLMSRSKETGLETELKSTQHPDRGAGRDAQRPRHSPSAGATTRSPSSWASAWGSA